MKQKKIWDFDTASKIAAAKFAKYGKVFVVVSAPDGGFYVKAVAKLTAQEFGTYNE